MNSCINKLTKESMEILAGYEAFLNKAMPLRAAHRRDLHYAVRDLSKLLTSDRGGMKQSYWSTPRNLSAYLRFFLPWNLYRMATLLPSLSINLEDGDTILDVGCGPLTFVQALWISRPDLRNKKLTFICADVASKPMETGHGVFTAMAGKDSPWFIRRVRKPIEKILRESYGKMRLVVGANVLNEMRPAKGQTMEDRLFELATYMGNATTENGYVLSIEPGTRLGGKTIAMLREGLIEEDILPVAPCPHAEFCPMMERTESRTGGRGQLRSGWCHFTHPANAPKWLTDLSQRAGFERDGISLSFVLSSHKEPEYKAEVRVLSEPIRLPGKPQGRYACSAKGLALLHDAYSISSGSLIPITWPEQPKFDEKSGALEIPTRRD